MKKKQTLSMGSKDHQATATAKKGERIEVVIRVDGKVVMAMTSSG